MIGRPAADRGAANPFGEKEDEVPARGRYPVALICTRVREGEAKEADERSKTEKPDIPVDQGRFRFPFHTTRPECRR